MLSRNEYSKWADLPADLSAVIARRLTSIVDYASFRAVCSSWRSGATLDNFDTESPRVPCLMFVAERGEKPKARHVGNRRGRKNRKSATNIWDLESSTFRKTSFPPATHRPYISCNGWILHVSNDSVSVSLTHFLLLDRNIKLPSLDTLPGKYYRVKKMVLSGSPMKATDLVVMVIWGSDQLAFCRPGDESWTVTDGPDYYWFDDVIYHNRKLYALDHLSRIVECDIHGSNPTKLVQVFDFVPDTRYVVNKFLVESFGKILVVVLQDRPRNHFRIFEIESMDGSYKEIDNLGKRCLFLSCSSSFCAEYSAKSRMNVEPNCIYSTDAVYKYLDSGLYKVSDGGRLVIFDNGMDVPHRVGLPAWVVPSI